MMNKTIVTIYGEDYGSCGYCKVENTRIGRSVKFGFESSYMLVEDYEQLMLVGWRRSGQYFYKPTMHKTCCPQYTIRLPVHSFKISKSQRQVLRRVERFLSTGDIHLRNEDINRNNDNNDKILTVETEKSSYSLEKFNLYKKYQTIVHEDSEEEINIPSFRRFLVDTPLKCLSDSNKYGSFHQLYRLNNQLIAVGVLDILPSGVSSVYLFYDPDYRQLVLGKYTALKEIEYCQSNHFPYYYMGFYVHTCQKMKYKGEYSPSELLCPVTLQWFLLSDCIKYLDKNNFTPLDPTLAEERLNNSVSDLSIYTPRFSKITNFDNVKLLYNNRILEVGWLTEESKGFIINLLISFYNNVDSNMADKLVIKLK